jgi:hypothetical protein
MAQFNLSFHQPFPFFRHVRTAVGFFRSFSRRFPTSTTSVKIFGNGLSLIGAFVFFAVFLIGLKQLPLINLWGDYWLSAYIKPHRSQHGRLMEQIGKGQTDQAIDHLQKVWENVQKKDRVYRYKRRLLFALATKLHQQQRYSELLYWSSKWKVLDGRDIDAIAFWYEALYRSTDRATEGFDGLQKEWNRFPYSFNLLKFYSRAVVEKGYRDEEVRDIRRTLIAQTRDDVINSAKNWKVSIGAENHNELADDQDFKDYVDAQKNLSKTWQLIKDFLNGKSLGKYSMQHGLTPIEQAKYWINKGATSKALFGELHAGTDRRMLTLESQQPLLVTGTDNWSRLIVQFEPEAQKIRIDLPGSHYWMKIQIDEVRLRIGGLNYDVPLAQTEIRNMGRVDGSLMTMDNASGSYFSFQVTDYLKNNKKEHMFTVELKVQIVTAMGNIALAEFSSVAGK